MLCLALLCPFANDITFLNKIYNGPHHTPKSDAHKMNALEMCGLGNPVLYMGVYTLGLQEMALIRDLLNGQHPR